MSLPTPQPPHDAAAPSGVRMRGFATRWTVENALAWLDAQLAPLPKELVPLEAAAGRVLAEPVASTIDVPGFARAMMDGYAVRGADTIGASTYTPLPLEVIGESLAGQPFAGTVAAGQAVRIMTGAPLPPGADAVLPAEQSQIVGGKLHALEAVPPLKHVGPPGEDVAAGSRVLEPGRRLRPQDLGLLSSIGVRTVAVVRQPRVRLVVTGNELLPAGSLPSGACVPDANGPMLAALAARDGGIVTPSSGIVPDRADDLLAALRDEADLVIVSGGTSVGQEDLAPALVAAHGTLVVHGIAMRPSSPTGIGLLTGRLVFLLPGNPVSCLCAYDFFAGRALRALGGRPLAWPYPRVTVPLARKLASVVGRVDYARVRLVAGQAEPLAIGGASVLSSTTRADGFVVVAAESEGYPPGALVEVHLYDVA